MRRHQLLTVAVLAASALAFVSVAPGLLQFALIGAASRGDLRLEGRLLSIGVDPNTKQADPGNAFIQAAYHGHPRAILLLARYGGRPDLHADSCDTALIYAAEHGQAGAVRALIASGANPNLDNGYGETPLTAASGDSAMTALLRNAGARN